MADFQTRVIFGALVAVNIILIWIRVELSDIKKLLKILETRGK